MATIQINLLQSGIEQGNIGSSGNTSSTKHLRTTLYIPYLYNINNIVTISATSSNTAKTVQCELIGYISDETTSRLFYKGFYDVPYEFDISSYSTVKFVRVLIRYSDSSVITPEEITSCTLSYNYMPIWTMDGEQAMPTQAMPILQDRFIKPYPATLWRIDLSNGGLPYNDLMPDILYYEPTPPPNLHAVKQRPYITVHAFDTPQDGFNNHGIFILTPTRCPIVEQLNGKYELSMEHPIDAEGRWEYIRENNIIKAGGQLFTIRTVNQQWKGSSGKITCKADHIFYQLSDKWIPRDSDRESEDSIKGNTVLELIHQAGVKMNSYYPHEEGETAYTFTINSNLTVPQRLGENKWNFLTKGMTPIEFLMGSNGVMSVCGGELHRDNFMFSLYERKEGAVDNAFEIRVGKNLAGIKRVIDISDLTTYVCGWNNYGYFYALSWNGDALRQFGVPHHIVREKNYEYELKGLYYPSTEEVAADMLENDIQNYFRDYCKPAVSYDIDLNDLRNNSEYAELTHGDYRVGNKGVIYDGHLGKIEIEITQTTTNAMTGEVEQVQFGSQRGFVQRASQTATIDIEPEVRENGFAILDLEGSFCVDADGALVVEDKE